MDAFKGLTLLITEAELLTGKSWQKLNAITSKPQFDQQHGDWRDFVPETTRKVWEDVCSIGQLSIIVMGCRMIAACPASDGKAIPAS